MLSKRMTAKSLELKPASQARNRMVKDSRDCHPAGCDRPPDRPPPPPPDPAVLHLSPTAVLLRPFPEYDAPEFSEDLCLLSETGWCSAIFYGSPVVASKRCELSFMTQERKAPLLLPFRCHAPLPKLLAPPCLSGPAPPKTLALIPNFLTLLPTNRNAS